MAIPILHFKVDITRADGSTVENLYQISLPVNQMAGVEDILARFPLIAVQFQSLMYDDFKAGANAASVEVQQNVGAL